ncbi:MAG: DUF2304 domain-containing protein [Saprospiraceae bacterium]|nr:DUF2304 domain-containing protein [Saprospiraceae bacterium]
MHFYQWLVPLIAIFYMGRIVRQYLQQKRLVGSMLIWLLFWMTVSLLAILPDFVSINIAEFLGFKSNINAVIFVALGFLLIFMFYLSATVEKLEHQVTDIVRNLALENHRLKEELNEVKKLQNEDSPSS